MVAQELRDTVRQQPFEPFRLVLSDGQSDDIRHPDLLWVGQWTAYVGLTGEPGKTFFERSVKVDLNHIVSIVPLNGANTQASNSSTSS